MKTKTHSYLAFLFLFLFPGTSFIAHSSDSDLNIFKTLAKKVVPSVVSISIVNNMQGPADTYEQELLNKFLKDFSKRPGSPQENEKFEESNADFGFNARTQQAPLKKRDREASRGTGFIIDAKDSSGIILTNNHVVTGPYNLKIYFTDDPEEIPTDGEIIGRDVELDLALIRVKTTRTLIPLTLGDSDQLEVGEYVMAVGNPFGQRHSTTHGIIAAKDRIAPDFPLARYLQTDAAINPGNSGGPLINLKGEVVGINDATDHRAHNIGFSIPINLVKKVLPQIRTRGTVTRGYIGTLVSELIPEIAAKLKVAKDLRATFVTDVHSGEPADQAGILPYDVILECNGKAVRDPAQLATIVSDLELYKTFPIKISRNGKVQIVNVKIAPSPKAEEASIDGGVPKKKRTNKVDSIAGPHMDVGMILEDLTPDLRRGLGILEATLGAVVTEIDHGGPANKVGIVRGDLIVEVDLKPIRNVEEFYKAVNDRKDYLLRLRRPKPTGSGETYSVILLDLK